MRSRSSAFLLLGSLYLSQGLPYGFFTQTVPVLLRQAGHPNTLVGLSMLLMLPWGLKWLWAPLVDSRPASRMRGWPKGLRRSWILPLQSASCLVLLALGLIDIQTGLRWMLLALLLINLFSATQDIATDGLAIEILPPEDRGWINGLQVGAYRLGMILGGGILLMFIDQLGWTLAFILLCAALALATVPAWRFREPARDPDLTSPEQSANPLRTARDWLALPGNRSLALALVLYKAFSSMGATMTKPLLVDLGYSLGQIGAANGTVGSLSALLGAFAGGWIVQRRGTLWALGLLGLAKTLSLATWTLPALGHGGDGMIYAAISIEHFWGSASTAALFAHMMNRCRPEHAGADYTVQASIVVLSTGLMASLSGLACDLLGYPAFFVSVSLLTGLGVWATLALTRGEDRPMGPSPVVF